MQGMWFWAVLFAALSSGCTRSVMMPLTVPALSAPACTGYVEVGVFEVESSLGLSVRGHGLHPAAHTAAALEYGVRSLPGVRERSDDRLVNTFRRQLRKALEANRRHLGEGKGDAPPTVRGTLVVDRRQEVDIDSDGGGESRVTASMDGRLVVLSPSGSRLAEVELPLEGERAQRPVTDPQFNTPTPVWRALEHLVRRHVSLEVLLAYAWSKSIRRGLRAAAGDDWQRATEHWRAASLSSRASVRRAAYFNLAVASEREGRFEEAKALLRRANKEPGAVGHMDSQTFRDERSDRVITPDSLGSHLWRLNLRTDPEHCD